MLAIASTLVDMARMRTPKLGEQLGTLGEFIAAQRRSAQLSLRQLAEQTGISNPYLSQIERGLRRPSAEVLQQLSKALRVSAESLYVRAGILDPDDHPATSVEMAVLADQAITERQRRVLIDVYSSFVKENEKAATTDEATPDPSTPESTTQGVRPMPRKQTPAQAKKAALESDYAALYAVAGLTDALADALKSALGETQEKANKRLTDLQSKRSERTKQAKDNADELREFVITLPEQFKNLPDATKARIAELQKQANDLIVQATATYAELAGRGKRAVDEARTVTQTITDKAEKRAEDVLSDVAERVDPAFERVQEGVTVARRTVTGKSATNTTTPRSVAKATAARQASAAETAAKREAATKKAAATRAAKKAAAESAAATPAKKAPAKKAPAKNAPANEGAARRRPQPRSTPDHEAPRSR